jgi:DNA-binding NarL/FixJ family response regulator
MVKSKTESKITDREKQVLSLLIDGSSNEEAAELLQLSRRTVEVMWRTT